MKKIHTVSYGNHFMNFYLIEEEDGLTLIDTGYNFCDKKILKYVTVLERPLRRILITHLHSDHVGGLAKIYQVYPEAHIYVSKKDYELIHKKHSNLTFPPEIKPYDFMNQGDRIKSLQVIETPGHTQGSVSFYQEETKSLFCGDAFQTAGGFAIAGEMKLLFPFLAMATWNKNLAKESALKVVRELEIKHLYPGHGKMITNLQELMRKYKI